MSDGSGSDEILARDERGYVVVIVADPAGPDPVQTAWMVDEATAHQIIAFLPNDADLQQIVSEAGLSEIGSVVEREGITLDERGPGAVGVFGGDSE